MSGRPIIVHHLGHAVAALGAAKALDVPVTLRSAPGAAAYLGSAVFRDMIAAALGEVPGVEARAVLDCGDAPGHALNALRQGVGAVRLDAPSDVRVRVGDIARQLGAALDDDAAPALDLLGADDPSAASRHWLGGG
jgi:hypothetical protein